MNNLSYTKKLIILAVATCLICVVFVKKKWQPTIDRWSTASSILVEQAKGTNMVAQKDKWVQLNTSLDETLLADNNGKERWAEALTLMASAQKAGGASLFAIEPEHVMQEQGFSIHSLPLVVTGNTAQILEFSRSLEEEIPAVHLYAMHMRADKRSYKKNRTLTSRFILRSIQP